MGIDSLEPLEPPPYGDNDLAAAKCAVGERMLLSGNIVAQDFLFAEDDEIEDAVRKAVRAGRPGGGFTLRCTNTYLGNKRGCAACGHT